MQASDIRAVISALKTRAEEENHRYMVVLSGSIDWSLGLLAALNTNNGSAGQSKLYIAESPDSRLEAFEHCKANKVTQLLGQEFTELVWNGCDKIHPEGLGASIGLLKGGGLFYLLLPDFASWTARPDADYKRMCASEAELSSCTTLLLQRLATSLISDTRITILHQHKEAFDTVPAGPDSNAPELSGEHATVFRRTKDQAAVIAVINDFKFDSEQRQAIVIQADRGRGKSSALGMAAASIPHRKALNIGITAPSPAACKEVFAHFESHTNGEFSHKLSFYAPDELLGRDITLDLLLVDEAAMIPAPMLIALCKRYSRCVLSTTVHGYEGTGRGFELRFLPKLGTLVPHYVQMRLSQPVRWARNDPLEEWCFKALCLDADISKSFGARIEETPEIAWLDGKALADDESLLRQTMGLLVLAHYQTSPDDLRLILDHPEITIGLALHKDIVVGVCLVIREGGIDDPELAAGLFNGTRRPRGHLVPQALSYSYGGSALGYACLRVMRIAVHPGYRRDGLGSRLLEATEQRAKDKALDYVSSSFGITPELLPFWEKNNYVCVRLGQHMDAASGTHSAIVAKAINPGISVTLTKWHKQFVKKFLFALPRQYRTAGADTMSCLLASLDLSDHLAKLSEGEWQAFGEHYRRLEEASEQLHALVIMAIHQKQYRQTLDTTEQQAIVMAIFQGQSKSQICRVLELEGKKALLNLLRESILKLGHACRQHDS